ncbi:MAG: hypothetical protein LBO66_00235 [Deltaproteobacteria bacterium]|nr:hypothetical protein [Deltaproteobacteria bacterium]
MNSRVPESTVVRNDDMGASLALLMKNLKEKMSPPGENARTELPRRRP